MRDMFLRDQDVSPKSRVIYSYYLQAFFLWLHREGKDIYSLRRSDIVEYKRYLQDNYNSVYTVRSYLSGVRLFFNWSEREGITGNPTLGIKQPKFEKTIIKMPLSLPQVKTLLNKIDCSRQIGRRDYAIIYMMVILGLRVAELPSIDISDIEEIGGIRVVRIKGKGCDTKSQVMKVDTKLYDVIESYLLTREFKENDPLFVTHSPGKQSRRISKRTIQALVKKYMKVAKLPAERYSSHNLRHTCATLMLEQGKPIEEVQRHMRHSNPDTTMKYLRFITEWKHLRGTTGNDIASLIK